MIARAPRFLVPLAVLCGTLALAPSASADALPPQACDRLEGSNDPSVAGQSCDVAGPSADEPGVCVAATCGTPERDGGVNDAGPPNGYPCYLCQVPASGTTSASNSSGGCSMTPLERDGSVGGAMLAVGLFAFAAGCRGKRASVRGPTSRFH